MCPEIEKQALLSFKQSLKDPNNQLSSWNNEVNCCIWKGVVCNNSAGHVSELHLRDLSLNDFGEKIPSFIGSLVSIEHLDLYDAGFHGAIPRTIGNLSNLRSLNLESRFTKTYSDDLDWLSGLSKLEKLDMSSVNLSKVSDGLHVFNALPSLSELFLRRCGLDLQMTPIDIVNFSSLHTLENNFRSLAFPAWTLQLTGLTYLDLSSNSIEGPIPTTSNTTLLEHIGLFNNRLNSTIPHWLYSCNNLEYLDLSFNSLVGTISNDISNLSSLVDLDLSGNNFNGNVPPGVWRSCNMQNLDLSWNKLQGEMSNVIGNMSDCFVNLEDLDLGHNSISGVIPFVLGELLSLWYLDLSFNKFYGNLPESIGRLSNLEWLDVSNNLLEGVVTESHLIDLKNLSSFDASRNKLITFQMSSNWIPPFQLSDLSLASTNLSGPFPSWLETQKNILSLDLSDCGIYGLVPNWVWSIPSMNLSHNSLYGNIPDLNLVHKGIYLSSNQFSGSLPHITSNVVELDLSNNLISGGLSIVICDGNATTDSYALEFLHLSGNKLSGELPDCWMRMKNLTMLNLGDNDLCGSIPSSIGLLTQLHTLNLCNNRISGSIPSSILNSRELVKLDLSGNYFVGNLPEWKESNSVNLRIIVLRSNRLRGRIDSDICLFTSLQILDLSHNSLYGTIPRCFHNFTAMVRNQNPDLSDVSGSYDYRRTYFPGRGSFIESVNIVTKGYQRQYDVLLPLVTSIDLSNNNLSGNIPREFTRLVSLMLLNLSRNHLTDWIPSDIGDMKRLESLDLSQNSLTGEIPNSFTVMSSLSNIDLSYNELTGRIPESTQLQTMNASSFVGNNLCGPPLPLKCGVEDDKHDSDAIVSHKSDVDWFIVLFSLGFTIGLSSFLVVIIFKKSLREAYFEVLDDIWEKIISSLKCN